MESKILDPQFTLGQDVIYGIHGKCSISSIEARTINGESIEFYKLEIQKPIPVKSTRKDTAIWLPVRGASKRGSRIPMNKEEADQAWKILSSREYYFNLYEKWSTNQPLLEKCVQAEGGIGVAKVVSFLYTLKSRQTVASNDVMKLYESLHKVVVREIADALGKTIKTLEDELEKAMKVKLLADS